MAHCLRLAAERYHTEPPGFSPNQMAQWMAHTWPGNVRELRNVADRLCLGLEQDAPAASAPRSNTAPLGQQMDSFERQLLVAALTDTQGQVSTAAERLHLPRKTLYDKLARHGIDPADYR